METTKKCPMCAEEIPLASATCEYCGAKFEVTSTGYCQNCHEVREADGNGHCKVCGNKVVDLRVENKFIEEAIQEQFPVSQPNIQLKIPETRKSRLPIGILAGILIFAVIGAVLWFGRNGLPNVFSLVATITPTTTATFTATPTLTPTATFTRTPRPTPTVTPDRRILNPANQHFYLYVRIKKPWHEARDYCAARGGHLVTIQTPSENKFVYNIAVPGNIDVGTWLGGTDEETEGTWTWVTGEPWRYQSWRRNDVETEPDNKSRAIAYVAEDIPNGADYLTFDAWDTTWHDYRDVERYFVCEWEP